MFTKFILLFTFLSDL